MSDANNETYLTCLCGERSVVYMTGNNNADGKAICKCGRHITVHLRRVAANTKKMPKMSTSVHCSSCGKQVSNDVGVDIVVRAFIECPECIERSSK